MYMHICDICHANVQRQEARGNQREMALERSTGGGGKTLEVNVHTDTQATCAERVVFDT